MKEYKPEICEHCHQSTTYLLGLDRGSYKILLKLLAGIAKKGINEIHPTRDLHYDEKEKWLPSNVSRPRKHGLIAFVKGKKGYYCLTRKAGQLLRGKPIPRYAIISKSEHHTLGYYEAEKYTVTAQELLKSDEIPFWEGDEQRIIDMLDPIQEKQAVLL